MNQAQRNYFVKRLKDIQNQKLKELKEEYARRREAVPSVRSCVVAYMKKHKKQAAEQLYAVALQQLENGGRWNAHIQLTEGVNEYVPQFLAEWTRDNAAVIEKLNKEETEKTARLNKKTSELTDKFYFSEMPAVCEELLKELEEFTV